MSNPILSALMVITTLCLFSCAKNNTDSEPLVPPGKKLLSAIGTVLDGDSSLQIFFNYNANGKIVKYTHEAGEESYNYEFARDVNDIVTSFKSVDSFFESGRELIRVSVEDIKPFYDKSLSRYTYAIRRQQTYEKHKDWVLEDYYAYRVDSIVYSYTADKVTSIEYYSRYDYPDGGSTDRDYAITNRMEMQRDAKGRVIRLKYTDIPEYGAPTVYYDSKFEYDEKINPLNLGPDGIFMIDDYGLASFDSHNNYTRHTDDVNGMDNFFEYTYGGADYPTSLKLRWLDNDGKESFEDGFYLYK